MSEIKILHKSKLAYSMELLSNMLSNLEFDGNYIPLRDEEFEFSDAVVNIENGFIIGFREPINNDIVSICCNIESVLVSYNDEPEYQYTYSDLLKLEELTEKYF